MASGSANDRTGRGGGVHAAAPLLVYGLLLAGSTALLPALRSLEAYWRSVHDYHHGYLIAAVTIGWLYLRTAELRDCAVEPSTPAAVLLAGAIGLWLIAAEANSQVGQQLLVPVVLCLCVWAGAGARAARLVLAPVAYLYFAVPVWELLIPALQHMTVAAAETGMAIGGVPTVVHDFSVSIPEGTFSIIEGCSGKKYLVAALATAGLGAAVNGMHWRRGLALMVLAAALSVLANWIRVTTVIAVGHLSHMQNYLVRVEHRTFGNVIWIVLLVVIFWIARRMSPLHPAPAGGAPGQSASPASARVDSARVPARALVPVALCAALLGFSAWADRRPVIEPTLPSFPVAASVWQGPLPGSTLWHPEFTGPSAERRGAYASRAGTVELYVNVYGRQQQGRKLVYFENTVLGPGDWQSPYDHGSLGDGAGVRGPRVTVATDEEGSHWLVSSLYFVGGMRTASAVGAQLMYGATAIARPLPSGVIATAELCSDPACAAARQLNDAFWRDVRIPLGKGIGDALSGAQATATNADGSQP